MRERQERLETAAAAKAQRERDRLETEARTRQQREAAAAERRARETQEAKEAEQRREMSENAAFEMEDARSTKVEAALRAREEKLLAARLRKEKEEADRAARRQQELDARKAEEAREVRERLQREKAAREEQQRQQAREVRESRERLERGMDDVVRARLAEEEQRGGKKQQRAWHSFRALWQGLRPKDQVDSSGGLLPGIAYALGAPGGGSPSHNRGPGPGSVSSSSSRHSGEGSFSSLSRSPSARAPSSPPVARKYRILGSSESPHSRSSSPFSSSSALPRLSSPLTSPTREAHSPGQKHFSGGSNSISLVGGAESDDQSLSSAFSSLVSAAPLALVVVGPGRFHLTQKFRAGLSLDDSDNASLSSLISPSLSPVLTNGYAHGHVPEDDEASVGSAMTMSISPSLDGTTRRRRRQPLLINLVVTNLNQDTEA